MYSCHRFNLLVLIRFINQTMAECKIAGCTHRGNRYRMSLCTNGKENRCQNCVREKLHGLSCQHYNEKRIKLFLANRLLHRSNKRKRCDMETELAADEQNRSSKRSMTDIIRVNNRTYVHVPEVRVSYAHSSTRTKRARRSSIMTFIKMLSSDAPDMLKLVKDIVDICFQRQLKLSYSLTPQQALTPAQTLYSISECNMSIFQSRAQRVLMLSAGANVFASDAKVRVLMNQLKDNIHSSSFSHPTEEEPHSIHFARIADIAAHLRRYKTVRGCYRISIDKGGSYCSMSGAFIRNNVNETEHYNNQ